LIEIEELGLGAEETAASVYLARDNTIFLFVRRESIHPKRRKYTVMDESLLEKSLASQSCFHPVHEIVTGDRELLFDDIAHGHEIF